MRQFKLLLSFILLINFTMTSQDLSAYRWKNRILLLCDSGEGLEKSKSQLKLFKSYQKELEERDLIILIYDGNTVKDEKFRTVSGVSKKEIEFEQEGVFLIGKDGGVKLESGFYTKPIAIFELIDSMPMRRAEMRRKNNP
ncbi:MAG: DUF4174 domain-containing protein [Muriicola sp.]|nr:DUF4174 domain-containing protein [Muriicola sp.]NNK11824.1 DUF4174 domain-containing protein [Flavobacteriaceae bacterium]NNK35085.1 DUF4174 domain-containing protein [Eudoraea sp.]